jgi:hypothetical protein
MSTVLVLVLAASAFFAVLRPIFGQPEPIPQGRPDDDIQNAVDRSIQELRTDLQLKKINEDDLKTIEAYLNRSSRED